MCLNKIERSIVSQSISEEQCLDWGLWRIPDLGGNGAADVLGLAGFEWTEFEWTGCRGCMAIFRRALCRMLGGVPQLCQILKSLPQEILIL